MMSPSMSIDEWNKLLATGEVTHVRPGRWHGATILNAYNRNKRLPLLGAIEYSEEAHQAARGAGVLIAEMF